MSSSALNLSASHTTVKSPGPLCGNLNVLDAPPGHQTQYLSGHTVASSRSVNARTIDDFSVKLADTPASALASTKDNKDKTSKADKQSGPAATRLPKSGKKKYECNVCGKELSCSRNLKAHQQTHEARNTLGCSACGKQFITEASLKTHKQKFHENSKHLLKCDICGQNFLFQSRYERHQEMHSQDSYQCPKCNKCFKNQSRLRKHIDRMHAPDSETKHIYTARNRIFPDSSQPGAHKLTHNNETFNYSHDHVRPAIQECPDNINRTHKTNETSHKYDSHNNQSATLSKPNKHHSTNKKHKFFCNICKARFRFLSNLNRHHQSVHAGEKNHLCEECGSRFSSKFILTRHINSVHINHRLFECKYCPKKFNRSDNLRNHLLTHTKEHNRTQRDTGSIYQTQSDNHNHEHSHKKDYKYSDMYSRPENTDPERILSLHMEQNHDDSQEKRCAARIYRHRNQEIPEKRLPEKQNDDDSYAITGTHSAAGQPSTNSTYINKSKNQEAYEELVDLFHELEDTLLEQGASFV